MRVQLRKIWSVLEMFFFSSRRRHTRCSRDWSSDVCSSDLNPNDGAQNAGAIDESLLAIVGVAVGIAERNELLFRSIHVYVKNLVTDFVADNHEAGRIPHRAFGKTKAGRHGG